MKFCLYSLIPFLFLFSSSTVSYAEEPIVQQDIDLLFWKNHEKIDFEKAKELEKKMKGKELPPDLVLFYKDKEAMTPLNLFKGQRHPIFSYRGPQTLTLFHKTMVGGEETFSPLIQTTLPLDAKKSFMVLFNLKDQYKILAVNTTAIPKDAIHFVNLSNEEVVTGIGRKTPIGVLPYQQKTFEITTKGPVHMAAIAIRKEDSVKMVYRSKIVMKRGQSFVSIFYQWDQGYKLLTFRDL